MEADFGTGAVLNFFTVGSALSILPVKRRLIPEARDGHRPRMVKRWVNLNVRGDIVGGVLKDHPFSVDSEFLGLEPVGCAAFLGLVQPACAHGSYFQTANLAVNRDIFGRLIESREANGGRKGLGGNSFNTEHAGRLKRRDTKAPVKTGIEQRLKGPQRGGAANRPGPESFRRQISCSAPAGR